MATSNVRTEHVSESDRPGDDPIDLLHITTKCLKKDKTDIFDNNKKLIDSVSGIAEMSEINDVLKKAEML